MHIYNTLWQGTHYSRALVTTATPSDALKDVYWLGCTASASLEADLRLLPLTPLPPPTAGSTGLCGHRFKVDLPAVRHQRRQHVFAVHAAPLRNKPPSTSCLGGGGGLVVRYTRVLLARCTTPARPSIVARFSPCQSLWSMVAPVDCGRSTKNINICTSD